MYLRSCVLLYVLEGGGKLRLSLHIYLSLEWLFQEKLLQTQFTFCPSIMGYLQMRKYSIILMVFVLFWSCRTNQVHDLQVWLKRRRVLDSGKQRGPAPYDNISRKIQSVLYSRGYQPSRGGQDNEWESQNARKTNCGLNGLTEHTVCGWGNRVQRLGFRIFIERLCIFVMIMTKSNTKNAI